MKKFTMLTGISVAILFTVNAAAQKVGYVNIQDIENGMPESAQADTAMRKYQQQIYGQYQAMQQELQSKAAAFVKDSAKMDDVIKQIRRESLQDLNNRIVRFQQNINQYEAKKYDELQKPIINKIQAAVNTVAKTRGYTYVFKRLMTTNSGPVKLLIVKPKEDDLTAAVKAELGLK
jgi:outer membrane protein